VVVSDYVIMGLVLSSGPEFSNKYITEVARNSLLDTAVMDSITKSTSRFVFVSNNVQEVIVSKRLVDVDALYGDVLHKLGDATKVDCGIYSMMGKEVLDWFPSMVRSTM